MRVRRQASVAVFALLLLPAAATPETLTLNTLDWPPYTSSKLANQGGASEIVKLAMASADFGAKVTFLPWKRAIAEARNGTNAIGYFPGYSCDHASGFVASAPVGSGTLGFAERTDNAFSWTDLDDLAENNLVFGTVLGYKNTQEFDEKVQNETLQTVTAKDDLTNLRNLQNGRVDAEVIDARVLLYLLATQSKLKNDNRSIQFNLKPLARETLNVCFAKTSKGEEVKKKFDKAIAEMNVEDMMESYLRNEF